MLAAARYALANIANPHGRDARQTFWYWVLWLVIARFAAGMVASVPMMVTMFANMGDAIRSGADPEQTQVQMMNGMSDAMGLALWVGMITGIATMALLATSLARRLHDIGRSGWWVLLPGALYAGAVAQMPAQVEHAREIFASVKEGVQPDPFAQLQGQGLLMLLTYLPMLIVIVIGAMKSQEGPNRFGDAPVRF